MEDVNQQLSPTRNSNKDPAAAAVDGALEAVPLTQPVEFQGPC
jgi:hypothetical protein